MTPKTLRVRARGTGLVQNYERLEASVNPANQFIGRRFEERKDAPGQYAFVPTNETEEVPYRPEYVLALQAGDLEAADDETARAAGLDQTKTKTKTKPSGDDGASKGGD